MWSCQQAKIRRAPRGVGGGNNSCKAILHIGVGVRAVGDYRRAMRPFLLTALTMTAFAANSLLNRAAVDGGHADAASFALLRVLAGAGVLSAILFAKRGSFDFRTRQRWGGAIALGVYMIGFSLAYVSLDAGVGALILFGTVQITLFAHSAVFAQPPNARQSVGALVAFSGLLLALWPAQGGAPDGNALGAVYMVAAGVGWAMYTLAGRSASDPTAATASHFVLCLPLVGLLLLVADLQVTPLGWALAITSGAVMSGLGYALWYAVLPTLPGARAAVVQLSVPVIAICLGAILLGEVLSLRVVGAAALVLGGIGLALRK